MDHQREMTKSAGSMVVTKIAKIKLKRPPEKNSVASQTVQETSLNTPPAHSTPPSSSAQHIAEDLSNGQSWWKLLLDRCLNSKYWPGTAHWTALVLIGFAVWGILYSVTDGSLVPDSQLFRLLGLFIAAYLAGEVTAYFKMPALLGMLLMGMLLRNVGAIHVSGDYLEVTATMREIALCVILTRAGLGLDPKALRSLSLMIFRLAAFPSIVEGAFTTVLSHYMLGLPWIWGVLLGSILAAVSPAVVIPCLFSLAERGYGVDKGIPTLVVAAASFDDILAISVFGVILGSIFASGDLTTTIIQGPLGVVIGITFGLLWGAVATQIPHKDDKNLTLLRSFMVGGGGLVAILGSGQLGYQGAGPLGCIVLAFVACLGWRRQGWTDKNNPVSQVFAVIWTVFQPILFGLIGSEVDISVLEASVVGYGILSLMIAIFARIVVSIFIAFGAGFTWKEKTFVAWAWFPKATVQAALGPVALDIARKQGTPEEIEYASKVLIVAVLAILVTAPIGAVLVTVLGPRLLTKTDPKLQDTQHPQQTPATAELQGH